MSEPSRRSSRLAIAAAAACALALGGGGYMLGRRSVESEAQAPPPQAAPVVAEPESPTLPAIVPPLGRAELIEAANRAADAFASGRPASAALTELNGREFELRLPFGCPGFGSPESGPLSWRYDSAAGVLRLRAEPARWQPEEWIDRKEKDPDEGQAIEAIEGFWIARPWASSEACPQAPPAAAPAVGTTDAPVETLGIAQFFPSESSRVGRRKGKAYEAVEKAGPEEVNGSQGFRLRLRGRIAQMPGGSAFLCRTLAGPGARPVCLVSAIFNEVAIENPATQSTIASWDVSARPTPAER